MVLVGICLWSAAASGLIAWSKSRLLDESGEFSGKRGRCELREKRVPLLVFAMLGAIPFLGPLIALTSGPADVERKEVFPQEIVLFLVAFPGGLFAGPAIVNGIRMLF